MPLLELHELSVRFTTPAGMVTAVSGVSLDVDAGACLAVVGESGSGKSQTFLACVGLLAANASVSGTVAFDGRAVLGRPEAQLRALRGAGVGFVFQDAPGSLTPHLRIGEQLVEALLAHRAMDRDDAWDEAARMLERVQVGDAVRRLRQYPHELSGGMRQRVAIAAALMPRPQLLIADEPTTALDTTVQAQVVGLFEELRRDLGMALVVVTHDLGVVAGLADKVAVMYAGRVVEEGPTAGVFTAPAHPYSAGLLAALPRLDDPLGQPMRTIPGSPPAPGVSPAGCAFAPRCPRRSTRCDGSAPVTTTVGARRFACHHPLGTPGP